MVDRITQYWSVWWMHAALQHRTAGSSSAAQYGQIEMAHRRRGRGMNQAPTGKDKQLAVPSSSDPAQRIGQAILDVFGAVPAGTLPHGRTKVLRSPAAEAEAIARAAATRTALAAGGLALPPGPLGWLTVLPELLAVWRLQAQMVADIAAAYGQQASLGREQMLYCLFRHTTAQAMRDIVARVGGRLLVREVPVRTLQRVARAVGVSISRRALGRGVARWMPVVGAVGVGAYAYFDTRQVARTAITLFGDADRVDSRVIDTV
jgi:hypothetical protein